MKSRKKKKYRKTIKRSNNKISIEIDFTDSEFGYSDMLNKKLLNFVIDNMKKGRNLTQTQDNKPFFVYKKSKLHLQAVSVKSWKQYPSWNQIQCKKYNDFIKTSPCKIGTNTKIFVKLKSNEYFGGFSTYIVALHLGIIDKKDHIEFVKSMKKTFKNNPVRVHNEDVDWFHLKQY